MKIALIPARGGSKRIPRKNIRMFAGKPIIGWSIETALKAALFDEIIVSTDDDNIAEIATTYGASVPFTRPSELADDFCGTGDVVKHAIIWLESQGCVVDLACCIYPTAPFLKPSYLKDGLTRLINSKYAFAFSVTSFPSPIQRALRINSEGLIQTIWPKNINARSQDLEEAFYDAGQFYWGFNSSFLNGTDIFSGSSLPIVLPPYLVHDIDTPEDWTRAEHVFHALLASGEFES